jgi:hypothetical protein
VGGALCASPSPTITAPFAETAVAMLDVPPGMKPRPTMSPCALQRNAWRLPAGVVAVPTTMFPSDETAVA